MGAAESWQKESFRSACSIGALVAPSVSQAGHSTLGPRGGDRRRFGEPCAVERKPPSQLLTCRAARPLDPPKQHEDNYDDQNGAEYPNTAMAEAVAIAAEA